MTLVARTLLLTTLCLSSLMAAATTPVRILPLGDSITHGSAGLASYRRSLWFQMLSAGYTVDYVGSHTDFASPGPPASHYDFDLDHEGHYAWEAGQLDANIATWLQGYTPDMALIHAGTNDVDRGQSNASTIVELQSIVTKLRADNPNIVILIAQIIPIAHFDVTSFNAAIALWAPTQSTVASPIIVVDQFTGFNAATDLADPWHPNIDGENKMVTVWFNAIKLLDFDQDSLSNEQETAANLDPNDPDTDGDGIGDAIDAEPLTGSNACSGDDATFTDIVMSNVVCAAMLSIAVETPATVAAGGNLELISPTVSLQNGFSADSLKIKNVTPCPNC